MIESSSEEVFESINSSKEYQEYQEIVSILNNNKEVKDLIEEIKELEKEATKLEYNNDDRYKEIDKIIEDKSNKLKENKDYNEYLSKLKKFNNTLLTTSSLLQEYIDEKVTI